MLIPVVMTLEPTSKASWMWVFYKWVSVCGPYRWPIIAQEEYFTEYEQLRVPEQWEEWYDVTTCKEKLENITQISIPQSLIDKFKNNYPSGTDAYVNSFTDDWEDLVDFLYDRITEIREKENDQIDGLVLFKYFKCFDVLAKRLNISTFYFEFGSLRAPLYRSTFYWSKYGLMGNAKLDEKWKAFKEENSNHNVPILTAREILALFLKKKNLKKFLEDFNEKTYEVGVMGSYSVPTPATGFNAVTLSEELACARRVFKENDIIVKLHPGDPLQAKPWAEHVEDLGTPSAEFIRKCRRIICAGSNACYEAALYGVPSYDFGWSQYAFISNKWTEKLEDKLPDNEVLSLIAFVCLAPMELLKDVEYLKMLLNASSETKIYEYNLKFYLNSYGIDYDELKNTKNRLELILKHRLQEHGAYSMEFPDLNYTPVTWLEIKIQHKEAEIQLKEDQLQLQEERLQLQEDQLQQSIQKFEEQLQRERNLYSKEKDIFQENNSRQLQEIKLLREQLQDLEEKSNMALSLYQSECEQYQQIITSTSFRITKPLRTVADFVKHIMRRSRNNS